MDAPRAPGHDAAAATLQARHDAGVALRGDVPRGAHAAWQPGPARRDPVAILAEQGASRIQELLPERHARMAADPFAFLRGAAAVMAADLATTPATGLRTQAGGDCHLDNFGSFAAPEGTPVFDINDFDETLPAPFEWDVKRLATSLAVAGRVAQLGDKDCRALARAAARAYRQHTARLAALPPLQAWSSRIDLAKAVSEVEPSKLRGQIQKRLHAVLASGADHFGLVEQQDGSWHIRENPAVVRHLPKHKATAREAFAAYAETLQEDRRVLLRRYTLCDVAFKVAGVGSVGTFCAIALLVSPDGAPLLLQIKEAQQSVLAPYAGASDYANHGQRVVVGQRMLQSASDVFLGWVDHPIGARHFYVRRVKDSRLADIGARLEAALPFYAVLCGRTLARAHARAGDAAAVAGYLGRGAAFEGAIADFATAYAGQTERDWQSFKSAIAAGVITARAP